MKALFVAILAGGLAISVALPAASAPPRATAPARDWSGVVTRTPAGSYVLGNPQAKVKVVEYASLTCSHCAAFAAEGWGALRGDQLKRGLVSMEMRHAVRDPADLAASLLARCAGPAGYFPAMERLFAGQAEWLPKAAAALESASGGDTPAARAATLTKVADAAGMAAIAGVPAAATRKCLANPAEEAVLTAQAQEAWAKRRIDGTPAFLINGAAVAGSDWATLQPRITAALR